MDKIEDEPCGWSDTVHCKFLSFSHLNSKTSCSNSAAFKLIVKHSPRRALSTDSNIKLLWRPVMLRVDLDHYSKI